MSTVRSVLAAPKRLVPYLIGAASVAADWISKDQVRKHLPPKVRTCLLDDLLCVKHIENPGAAFDIPLFFSRPLIIAFTAALFSAAVAFCVKAKNTIDKIALALIAGGIAGNGIDRISDSDSVVTDFVQTVPSLYPYSYNVADAAMTLGFLLLLYRWVRHPDS